MKLIIHKYIFIGLLFLTPSHSWAEVSADHWLGGAVVFGNTATGCDSAHDGMVRFSSADQMLEVCDGTGWKKLLNGFSSGDTAPPAAGTGYFVLSSGTWTGSMGQISGANTLCLNDLTSNDWLNKNDAVARGLLIASNVRAFLCGASCQNLNSNTRYTFAVSGWPAIGGASFVTDGGGLGPNDSKSWAGMNYFGGSHQYWTGRSAGSDNQLWPDSTSTNCASGGAWNWAGNSFNGRVGRSNPTDIRRWAESVSVRCIERNRLICVVNP